jgi:hypothetical protein
MTPRSEEIFTITLLAPEEMEQGFVAWVSSIA